ncbi:unnamed protein product [Acanthoscelides obtectus]|uniref:Uncharacterized protein n=1 Tax=Acanthoscelides obtectus TaxID=200917 RepID=A0A9P0LPH3_ACAOB|nr:unnamed protein product [Acanthoscelides obtectus]CAK1650255.1 hypothetical protein AOBTE_LOCUS16716 [Acanthoscelides obtectus]
MLHNEIQWKTIVHATKVNHLNGVPVIDHPLKNVVVTERIPRKIFGSQPGTGRTTPISSAAPVQDPLFLALEQLDPLSEFAMLEIDPLSKMAAEMVSKTIKCYTLILVSTIYNSALHTEFV